MAIDTHTRTYTHVHLGCGQLFAWLMRGWCIEECFSCGALRREPCLGRVKPETKALKPQVHVRLFTMFGSLSRHAQRCGRWGPSFLSLSLLLFEIVLSNLQLFVREKEIKKASKLEILIKEI